MLSNQAIHNLDEVAFTVGIPSKVKCDIWTWSCEMVAYEGNTYADLPPEIRTELEAIYPWGATQRSVWNKYGIWAFVGLAGIGIFMSNSEDEG